MEVTQEAVKARARPGRTSLKGVHCVPRKHVRRAYSYEAKQDILRDKCGLEHVIAAHWPGMVGKQRHGVIKLLSKWRKSRTKIEAADTTAKRAAFKARPCGFTCVLPVDVENSICGWVRALREDGVPVSHQMLKLQALDAADLEGIVGFAASDDWVEGFKRRHSLSMRARGSQGQKHPKDIQ